MKRLFFRLIWFGQTILFAGCQQEAVTQQPVALVKARWELTNFGDSLSATNQVKFITKEVGFITGGYRKEPYSPVLLQTTSGGTLWETIGLKPPTLSGLSNFNSVDDTLFFATGQDLQSNRLVLFRSQDRARTWKPVSGNFPSEGVQAMYFINSQRGVAQSQDGLLSTTDAGQTWQSAFKEEPYYQNFDHLFFCDTQIGYAAGGIFSDDSDLGAPVFNSGAILKTTDGGLSWQKLSRSFTRITSLFFLDTQKGFLTTIDQEFWTTLNGGATWQKSATKLPGTGVDLVFFSEKQGVLVANGGRLSGIFYTDNGGLTWQPEYTTAQFTLTSLSALNAQTIYVTGTTGKLLKRILL